MSHIASNPIERGASRASHARGRRSWPVFLAHDGENPGRARALARAYRAATYAPGDGDDPEEAKLVDLLLLVKASYLVGNPASTFSIAAHSVRRLYGPEASSTLARDFALTSPPPDRV